MLLLGASGAGKSTLLRSVAGVLDSGGDVEGDVEVDGIPTVRGNPRVGLLLQDPDAHLVLSRVEDDVAFGLRTRGMSAATAATHASAALESVGLSADLHGGSRRTDTLSGGERQRVALAGVLATHPSVMLLDEPTSMLDSDGAQQVRQAVSTVARETGVTLIVVEHRVDEWLELVDRVVVIGPGGVQADGAPGTVLSNTTTWAKSQTTGPGVWLPGVPWVHRPSRTAGLRQVETENVSLRYRGAPVDAVHEVSVTIDAGHALALTGANGSGKSSLALLVGGLTAPTGGQVRAAPDLLLGLDETRPHRWRSRDLAQRIGSVFQNPEHAFVAATVAEELAAGPRAARFAPADVRRTVDELLERTHLQPLADANPFTLSGGQQRRLSVAAALAARPRVLVLDEPTFGQDPRTWQELVELLGAVVDQGMALVVATHDERFVAAVADCVVRLTAGRRSEAVP